MNGGNNENDKDMWKTMIKCIMNVLKWLKKQYKI